MRFAWVACVATLACLLGAAPAVGACPPPAAYPGDDAPKVTIAQWMGGGAAARGLPRELPVMGGLVASDLRNLPENNDEAGFFGMRVSIWNGGEYAGFPDDPSLQLRWFTDYARSAREERIADGRPDPIADELLWGDWAADVLRPAEQYRHLYQERLGEARELLGPDCAAESPPPESPPVDEPPPAEAPAAPASPGTAPVIDTLAPVARLAGPRRQRAVRTGAVAVVVGCPAERCIASATGRLSVPGGAARVFRLRARARAIEGGARRTLRLRLGRRARAAARRALRRRASLRAVARVIVADAAGNRSIATRTIRIVG